MATFDNTAADPNTATSTGFNNTGASTKTAAATGFDDTEAEVETAAAAGFVNTGANTKTAAAAGFDDTEAGTNTESTTGFNNASASQNAANSIGFSNTGAESNVVDGEAAPVSGGTVPNILTTVAHTATLASGTNYAVNVSTRSAPVTVVLPDPPSEHQIIEIRDTSLQASQHAITVDPGTKKIDGSTTDYVLNFSGQVLRLAYLSTLTQWKII